MHILSPEMYLEILFCIAQCFRHFYMYVNYIIWTFTARLSGDGPLLMAMFIIISSTGGTVKGGGHIILRSDLDCLRVGI